MRAATLLAASLLALALGPLGCFEPAEDAASPEDAGSPSARDASAAGGADAEEPGADAASGPDAAASPDAGSLPDAAASDAAFWPDAAIPSDASVVAPDAAVAGLDAGSSDAGASGCNALVPAGPYVSGTAQTGQPPAMTGGTLNPGTYELTAFDCYGTSAPYCVYVTGTRQTLVVGPAALETATEQPGAPLATASFTWFTSGSQLTFTTTCGSASGGKSPYVASPTRFILSDATGSGMYLTYDRK